MYKTKYKLKDCYKLASLNNGKVFKSKILNKFFWTCNRGHSWDSSAEAVELGAWCSECYFNEKSNIDPRKQNNFASIKNHYYLYKTVNLINNKFYIGVHCTNNLNDEYLGSGKLLKNSIKKYGKENFIRQYIEFFDDARSALSREKQIVTREFVKLTTNYNYAEGGGGGYIPKTDVSRQKLSIANKNMVSCIDDKGIKRKITKKEFDSNPFIFGHTKGMLMMRDNLGNICRVNKDDPRINSGELLGSTTGFCVMKDKNGKTHNVFKDDPRISSGELVGITKGSSQSKESNEKRRKTQTGVPKPQPYYSCNVCKTSTVQGNISRWHNDNCKFKHFPNPEEKLEKWNSLPQFKKNKIMQKYKKTGILDI